MEQGYCGDLTSVVTVTTGEEESGVYTVTSTPNVGSAIYLPVMRRD